MPGQQHARTSSKQRRSLHALAAPSWTVASAWSGSCVCRGHPASEAEGKATRVTAPAGDVSLGRRRVALVDLLDRVLACGVVIIGDVVLSVADVDMVRVSLRAIVQSVPTGSAEPDRWEAGDLRASTQPLGW